MRQIDTRMKRMKIATTVLAALVIAAPATAKGDDAASRAYAKATQLFKDRKYVPAIESFKLAYKLKPHFYVQCSIARCYENLNNMVKAAEHYQRCLDEGAATASMGPRIKSSLKAVEAQITLVRVLSPGKGGTIFVNGNPEGKTPKSVLLNPGTHTLEVRRPGAKPARSTIKTLGGEQRELSLVPVDLEPSAPASATQPAGTRPEGDGQRDRPRRRLSQVWFWSGVAATVAFATAALALGAKTIQAGDAYDEDPTEDSYNTFTDFRLATNIFWALTAVAAGGTTALFFYTDFGGSKEKVSDQQARRPVTMGIGIQGTF